MSDILMRRLYLVRCRDVNERRLLFLLCVPSGRFAGPMAKPFFFLVSLLFEDDLEPPSCGRVAPMAKGVCGVAKVSMGKG